jgi:hypothetical protein
MPSTAIIIDEMHELSEDEQRALAAEILADQKLEAFVEELEDHLSCERAAAGERSIDDKTQR